MTQKKTPFPEKARQILQFTRDNGIYPVDYDLCCYTCGRRECVPGKCASVRVDREIQSEAEDVLDAVTLRKYRQQLDNLELIQGHLLPISVQESLDTIALIADPADLISLSKNPNVQVLAANS